eukprot:331407_1
MQNSLIPFEISFQQRQIALCFELRMTTEWLDKTKTRSVLFIAFCETVLQTNFLLNRTRKQAFLKLNNSTIRALYRFLNQDITDVDDNQRWKPIYVSFFTELNAQNTILWRRIHSQAIKVCKRYEVPKDVCLLVIKYCHDKPYGDEGVLVVPVFKTDDKDDQSFEENILLMKGMKQCFKKKKKKTKTVSNKTHAGYVLWSYYRILGICGVYFPSLLYGIIDIPEYGTECKNQCIDKTYLATYPCTTLRISASNIFVICV